MSSNIRIVFLGLTGYLGGTLLEALLTHPNASQFDITAFVRSEEKASDINNTALGVKAISGTFSKLEEAVSIADVVFNIASSDDLPMTQAIIDGARKRYASTKTAPVVIHVSGSAIIADFAGGQHLNDKRFIATSDIPLAEAHEQGFLKSYILAPPLIWGLATGRFVDAGLQNPAFSSIKLLSRIVKRRGVFGFVGPQLNAWSTIEVHDLAQLIVTMFNTVVIKHKEIAGGKAYYFSANGDVVSKEYLSRIAHAMHKYGLTKTADITEFTPEEIAKWPILNAFAINSRTTDARSRSLGWAPVHTVPEFLDSIDESIKVISIQKEDFGAHWMEV
ncbi:hypothetical protein EUX98_g3696 [Antrodiella citrinella]|uniref:NAD(P)-binding domain-containing protein n=1 Tax=Antrodiella citrinella TaxID=2447956 RepID=A0A4S4MYN1_9APHY|nr:hypothetical protein EUX98_g3696 [Antrodiella citrinella]